MVYLFNDMNLCRSLSINNSYEEKIILSSSIKPSNAFSHVWTGIRDYCTDFLFVLETAIVLFNLKMKQNQKIKSRPLVLS